MTQVADMDVSEAEVASSSEPASRRGADPDDQLTDLANARRLVATHGTDLRYCKSLGWLVWDGRRWANDGTGEVERRAKATVRSLYREAESIPDPETRRSFVKRAISSEFQGRIAGMIKLAKTEPGVPATPGEFDTDPWLLTVLNGTVQLRNGTLRVHRREDLITKLAPVQYDATAECPRWLQFLDRITNSDPELIEYLRRAVGYSLTGDTREQVLFILHGTGANGKSTFLNTISTLLGDYARHTSADTLLVRRSEGPRDDLARLHGARFVSAVEAECGRQLAETLVKQLTGGDPITARYLYQALFTFQPTFKLFLAVNHKPVIQGTDEGIWRRIRMIPFEVTIPEDERDKTLGDALRRELPGILRWVLDGCLTWQRTGLAQCRAVEQASRAYRTEMDTFTAFLDDACVSDVSGWVATKQLYEEYAGWCRQTGERQAEQRAFVLMLQERGYEPKKRGGDRGWLGLRLREDQAGAEVKR
jgi:putative DNA primase/helicase